jgi:hypothetical protein
MTSTLSVTNRRAICAAADSMERPKKEPSKNDPALFDHNAVKSRSTESLKFDRIANDVAYLECRCAAMKPSSAT